MKKLLTAILVFAFVLCMAAPVFAVQNKFVPSISVKGAPSFVVDANGHIGTVHDAEGNFLDHLSEDCLLITSVAELASSDLIPDAAAALLLDVYNKLISGEMVLSVPGLSDDKLTVRELVDISWLCDEHEDMVAPQGVQFTVTIDLGVGADKYVHVFTYKNNTWNPIVDVVNNGDGTVTCTFENLCPVAFAISDEPAEDPINPPTGVDNDVFLWGSVLMVSMLAVVAVFALRRKENRA